MCVGWTVLELFSNESCLEHLVGVWALNESTRVVIQSVLQLATISFLPSVKLILVTSNTSN